MSTIIIGATLNRAVGDTNIYIVLSKTFVLITGGGDERSRDIRYFS